MSSIFLKNNIKNTNTNSTTESSVNFNKFVNIKNSDKNLGNTSTTINNFSATSTLINQIGGVSSTSTANLSKINSSDINNLLAMLTSESGTNTNTENLENKLVNLLKQGGGNESENTETLENKLNNLLNNNTDNLNTETLESKILDYLNNNKNTQSGGGIFSSLLTLGALGTAGVLLSATESDSGTTASSVMKSIFNKSASTASKVDKSISTDIDKSKSSSNLKNYSKSSTSDDSNFVGGDLFSDTSDYNLSMEGSDEDSDEDSETNVNRLNEMLGGADRLKPFRDLCEYLADKLNSKLTPNLRKIASQLQKDVRKKHSDVTNDTILEYSKKYFNENKSNYEKMLKDMLKNKNKKY